MAVAPASSGPRTDSKSGDTQTDKVLNPLLFGFPVRDNIAPDLLRLAVYDRNISAADKAPILPA